VNQLRAAGTAIAITGLVTVTTGIKAAIIGTIEKEVEGAEITVVQVAEQTALVMRIIVQEAVPTGAPIRITARVVVEEPAIKKGVNETSGRRNRKIRKYRTVPLWVNGFFIA
jgi:hypothetical protein